MKRTGEPLTNLVAKDQLVRASEARKILGFSKTIDLVRAFEELGFKVFQRGGARTRQVLASDIRRYQDRIERPPLAAEEAIRDAAVNHARREAQRRGECPNRRVRRNRR